MKAEDRGGTPPADGVSPVVGAQRVSGVLDQRETATGRDRAQRIEIDGLAGEVHRDYRPGARRDRTRHRLGLDVERSRVDIHEDRPGTHGEHHVARGGPRHGCGDHLVARADACRQQREVEARGAGRDGHGVACADGACECFLEAADARAAGEPARAQAGSDLCDLFRPDRRA